MNRTYNFNPNKWTLIASKKDGAGVVFGGQTKEQALNKFLNRYNKKGFKLTFVNNLDMTGE